MNKIKQAMEEQLNSIEVTDSLKRRTLRKIKQSHPQRIQPRHFLKYMTLASSFVLMLVLGFNVVYAPSNQNQVTTTEDSNFPQIDFTNKPQKNGTLSDETTPWDPKIFGVPKPELDSSNLNGDDVDDEENSKESE